MIRYRARWVLPIHQPPIANGWCVADGGRLVAVGSGAPTDGIPEIDFGSAALMPGLVNAHTHLELSYLHDRVPPAASFVGWIRGVMAARRLQPDAAAPEIMAAIDRAIREADASGTAVVGDIANTLVTCGPLAASSLAGVVFYELIRFTTPDPDSFVEEAFAQLAALPLGPHVRASLAAHAPYSVARGVFAAIRRVLGRHPEWRSSVHLSESVDEVEFITHGGGAWRDVLEQVGAWDPAWIAPAVSPVEFLDAIGFLHARVLTVHAVQASDADLERLRAHGATVVACPRSNEHTGAGTPPIARFYASGVHVAVGTDSLASTSDLNVFSEVRRMRELAPSVPAARLLASATLDGARALGFDADFGTIEAGKSSRLLAVDMPAGVSDVEEYLVNGITPGQLRWTETGAHTC